MITEQIPTRAALRDHTRRTLQQLVDAAVKRVHQEPGDVGLELDEKLQAWEGVPVVTLKDLQAAIYAAFDEPLPPPAEHTVEVSTPATVLVTAFCPRCHQAALMELSEVEPDLIVHANGSGELKLKAKTKPRAHVCGQMPLPAARNGHDPQMSAFDEDAAADDEQLALGPGSEPAGPIPPAIAHDMLLLVLPAEEMPSIEVVEGWDQDTLEAVVAWAGAVHLAASDNDDVEIPPKPAVLEHEPLDS